MTTTTSIMVPTAAPDTSCSAMGMSLAKKTSRLLDLLAAVAGILTALACGTPDARAAAAEQHWPQWRGPLVNGVAPDADPPVTWSETSNIKWKVRIPGSGTGTPIIWRNQIFIETAIATGKKAAALAPKAAVTP